MMQLANASAHTPRRPDGREPNLLGVYLDFLHTTGRGNSAYEWAARKFFTTWPNPEQWTRLPLEERLAADRHTRPIITYLMLHQELRPGYDYLLERKLSSLWRDIAGSRLNDQIDRFLTAAADLGYTHRVRVATGSQVPIRLLIQTGKTIDDLTQDDLDDFRLACHERTRRTGINHHHYHSAISTTQRVLFHLGIVDAPPRSGGPTPFAERLISVTPGLREEMIAYLNRKSATCTTKTVSGLATRLKHFGTTITDLDADLTSIADLDRRTHIEPWLASLPNALSDKDGHPISIGDRHRRVIAVSTFLTDITEWGWKAAPSSKVLFRDDIPKLPRPLPRYIPIDADRNLQQALATDYTNELAALALRVQRACGLRIGELLDLELDCVHEIDGQGAWLKVPLGKLDTERMIPLDDETLALIDRITAIRSPGAPLPHPRYRRRAQFLFTYLGRRLSQQGIRSELAHAATIAGIDHVTSHQLRHTYATALVNAGVSLQALMALLGHVSAEMSLRYGRLFDTTVRQEYERALALVKTHISTTEPAIPIAAGPGGRSLLPLADITGGKDWKDTPLLKSRMAGGFCLRSPAQGACPYANICEHCPSYRTDASSLPILTMQRVDAAQLAADAQERGWIDEAKRHEALLARLDTLIATTEESAG